MTDERADYTTSTSTPMSWTPPYPVPRPPGPWWNLLGRFRRHRLQILLDAHRMTTEAHQGHISAMWKASEAEKKLERVRAWNTTLLKEKAELRQVLADREANLTETHGRLMGYLEERDRAMRRSEALEHQLAEAIHERIGMEAELKRAMTRCDDLAVKLRERKKR